MGKQGTAARLEVTETGKRSQESARGSCAKSAASDGGLDNGFRRLKIGYSVTLPVSVSVPCRSRFAIGVAVRCLGITGRSRHTPVRTALLQVEIQRTLVV